MARLGTVTELQIRSSCRLDSQYPQYRKQHPEIVEDNSVTGLRGHSPLNSWARCLARSPAINAACASVSRATSLPRLPGTATARAPPPLPTERGAERQTD